MNKESGFTLLETMFALAIMAIVLAMAVPSMTAIVKNNRMITQANEFLTAIQLARSEAVKRGDAIDIIATGGDWNNGWTVQTTGGTVIRTFGPMYGGVTLTSTGGFVSFQYQGTGMINNGDTLEVCDDRTDEHGRQIVITGTGRVTINDLQCL